MANSRANPTHSLAVPVGVHRGASAPGVEERSRYIVDLSPFVGRAQGTSSNGLKQQEPSAVGSNFNTTLPSWLRRPAVRRKFSPLMSITTTLSGHVSKVGITTPMPLPERGGAMAHTLPSPRSLSAARRPKALGQLAR